MKRSVVMDLNADVGEFPDDSSVARDAELMRYVTTANVACGGHAGDEMSIRRIITSARAHEVAVGAHPGYPDRKNSGRVEMRISLTDLEISLSEQVYLVSDIAQQLGMRIRHVKPHGALYHAANKSTEIATTIARAVVSVEPKLILVGQSGSAALEAYRRSGLQTAEEAFVDRRYERDGRLRDRGLPGALLESELARQQALQIALHQSVLTLDGTVLPIKADTICLHSDTPDSVMIAQRVSTALVEAGVHVKSFS